MGQIGLSSRPFHSLTCSIQSACTPNICSSKIERHERQVLSLTQRYSISIPEKVNSDKLDIGRRPKCRNLKKFSELYVVTADEMHPQKIQCHCSMTVTWQWHQRHWPAVRCACRRGRPWRAPGPACWRAGASPAAGWAPPAAARRSAADRATAPRSSACGGAIRMEGIWAEIAAWSFEIWICFLAQISLCSMCYVSKK